VLSVQISVFSVHRPHSGASDCRFDHSESQFGVPMLLISRIWFAPSLGRVRLLAGMRIAVIQELTDGIPKLAHRADSGFMHEQTV
jgi:hypothetical protein